jgi:hypothetical protein
MAPQGGQVCPASGGRCTVYNRSKSFTADVPNAASTASFNRFNKRCLLEPTGNILPAPLGCDDMSWFTSISRVVPQSEDTRLQLPMLLLITELGRSELRTCFAALANSAEGVAHASGSRKLRDPSKLYQPAGSRYWVLPKGFSQTCNMDKENRP